MATKIDNFDDFSKELNKFKLSNIPNEANKFQRVVALKALTGIVEKTPVGNPDVWKDGRAPKGYVGGTLRQNWQLDIGTEADHQILNAKDGKRDAISNGLLVLSRLRPFENVIISNNVDYVLAVENGHSTTQAPNGMVELTVQGLEFITR